MNNTRCYRPRSEASEGYVFTGICLSNSGGGGGGEGGGGGQHQRSTTTPSPPPTWDMVNHHPLPPGMHPTGMHSCFNVIQSYPPLTPAVAKLHDTRLNSQKQTTTKIPYFTPKINQIRHQLYFLSKPNINRVKSRINNLPNCTGTSTFFFWYKVTWGVPFSLEAIQTNNSQRIRHRKQAHHFKCTKYLRNHLCRENKWKRRDGLTNGDYIYLLPLATESQNDYD